MRFFRDTLGTFLTEIAIVGLNLTIGVITARVLGPERRGVLTLVMTLPLTLMAFADPGISQANVYLLGRKRAAPGAILANSALLAIVIGVLMAGGLWFIRDLALGTVLVSLPTRYFVLILALTPILLLYTYSMAVMRGLQRFGTFNLLRLLMPSIILVLVSAAFLGFNGGIGWATVAYAAGMGIASSGAIIVIWVRLRGPLRLDWSLMAQGLLYGAKSYIQNLVGHLTYRLDIYLVAFFLTPAEIAFYAIATSFAECIWYIPNSVGLVLFPKLTAMQATSAHRITAEICRHTLFATTLAGIGALVLGCLGIPLLYGPAYEPAVAPLLILVPGTAIMTIYKIMARNFSSLNRQEITIVAGVLGLTLNGLLDWYLIPRMGIIGAALGSSLAYCLAGLLLLTVFHRISGLGWAETLWLQAGDMARYRALARSIHIRLATGSPAK